MVKLEVIEQYGYCSKTGICINPFGVKLLLFCFLSFVAARQNETPVYKCVKWQRKAGDYINNEAVCLEWKEIDCSKRLHKNHCKTGL